MRNIKESMNLSCTSENEVQIIDSNLTTSGWREENAFLKQKC